MKKIMGFMPFFIFIGIIAMFVFGMWGHRVSTDKSPLIGKPLEASQLIDLNGQDINIKQPFERPIILNFFASWCAPCRQEHPQLLLMAKSNKFDLIGVAYRDDPRDTYEYIAALGNPYKIIASDRQGAFGSQMGLTGVPETYIISKSGIILYKHKGEITAKDIPKLEKMAIGSNTK